MNSLHPYYPPDLILEGYKPNTRSTGELIGAWLMALSALTLTTLAWLAQKKLSLTERLTVLWFMICGSIHVFFEGHFVLHHRALASLTDIISQEFKEYAKSDSRYLSSDSFVLSAESITAFVLGPLCFYIAFSTANRSSSRHVWTMLVSFAHLYSCALYFGTAFIDGCPHTRPEFLYYWIYFIGLNALWLITPIILLTKSITTINAVMARVDAGNNEKKTL